MGGLGNQLFQIFATMAYALQNEHGFVFPYTKELIAGKPRNTYWENFLKSLKQYTTYNSSYMLTNTELENFPETRCPFHNYQIIPIVGADECARLFGYFQSHKYFENEQEFLFTMIDLDQQLNEVLSENAELFDTFTVSIHFRLGDYKHIQDCHNILPYKYYEMALENVLGDLIHTDKKQVSVIYFCEEDDNDVVSAVIEKLSDKFGEDFAFVKARDDLEDWKQMLMMACCNYNIIANSSFSWWGAYFNRNLDKRVYYPSVWFGPCLNHNYMGDMFPDGWKRIDF
jgi:hypothetical protein